MVQKKKLPRSKKQSYEMSEATGTDYEMIVGQNVNSDAAKAKGRWTRDEHYRFLEALKHYGKEWKHVQ